MLRTGGRSPVSVHSQTGAGTGAKRCKPSETWHRVLGIHGFDLQRALPLQAIPVNAYNAPAENRIRKVAAAAMRFAVGDEVDLRVDGKWLRGTVVALNWPETVNSLVLAN